ncbi:MAG: hypothetical protein IT557_11850 [Alphaproteobacteria bacterium]|nr:hypothetical protein [Alphaproteobacteria bacterium]
MTEKSKKPLRSRFDGTILDPAPFDRVQPMIDAWLARYPESHRNNLASRFRRDDTDAFRTAFFELALHELVIRADCTVLEIEPTLRGTARKPDFLVRHPAADECYIEATTVAADRDPEDELIWKINKACKGWTFRASIDFDGDLKRPFSHKEPIKAINEWARKIENEYKTISSEMVGLYVDRNEMRLQIGQCDLRLTPEFGLQAKPSGAFAHFIIPRTKQVNRADRISKALVDKGRHYKGGIDRPFIVAVNDLDFASQGRFTEEALFGPVVFWFDRGTSNAGSERLRGGLWNRPGGASYTRISAVVSFDHLDPWNIRSARARVIHNPHASRPLPRLNLGIEEHVQGPSGWRTHEGRALRELLAEPLVGPQGV